MSFSKVKSFMRKRLLTVLLVPAILGSNLTAIQVSADETVQAEAASDNSEGTEEENTGNDDNGGNPDDQQQAEESQEEAGDQEGEETSEEAGESGDDSSYEEGSEDQGDDDAASGSGSEENSGGDGAGDSASSEESSAEGSSEAASESSSEESAEAASSASSEESAEAASSASSEDKADVSDNSSKEEEPKEDVSGNSKKTDNVKKDEGNQGCNSNLSNDGIEGTIEAKMKDGIPGALITITIPVKHPFLGEHFNCELGKIEYKDVKLDDYVEFTDVTGWKYLSFDRKYVAKCWIASDTRDTQGVALLSDYVSGIRLWDKDLIKSLDGSITDVTQYPIKQFDPMLICGFTSVAKACAKYNNSTYYFFDGKERKGFVTIRDDSGEAYTIEVLKNSGESTESIGNNSNERLAALTGIKAYYDSYSQYEIVLGEDREDDDELISDEGVYRVALKATKETANTTQPEEPEQPESSTDCIHGPQPAANNDNTKILKSDDYYVVDCTEPTFDYDFEGASDAGEISIAIGNGTASKKNDNGSDQGEKKVPVYTGDEVSLNVMATDKWLDSDRKISYAKVACNGVPLANLDWCGTNKDENDCHTKSMKLTEEGLYEITYNVSDMAKHSVDSNNKEKIYFFYDKSAPVVDAPVDNGVTPKNGKYYAETREFTINFTEANFAKAELNLTKGDKSKVKFYEPEETGSKKSCRIVFEEDGTYEFTVKITDLANRETVTASSGEFVIDKTKPVVDKVSFDNNSAKNGFYYNSARTASIEISDRNLDKKSLSCVPGPDKDGSVLPAVGESRKIGDNKNVANMKFTADGEYQYTVTVEDLAGNKSEPYPVDKFVIDTKSPEITFSGVENYSANNGVVAPVAEYVDKYMDMDSAEVTITGANHGVISLGSSSTKTENGYIVNFDDFARSKDVDDLYTLNVKASDLAGNVSDQKLVFSVNRFGSVFVLGDATKAMNDQYYVQKASDVVVTEINVDELVLRDLSLSRDGNMSKLDYGTNYTVSKQGDSESWKTYTYTVSKDNFAKDGIYNVTVYTKDRATNVQDNKSRDAEIEFAVDATAPSIVVAGIEDNGFYQEESHEFNIDASDNMGIVDLVVTNNGKTVKSFTGAQIEANGNLATIVLNENDKAQNIKLVATDLAGNKKTLEFKDIIVSTKVQEPEVDTKDDNNKADNGNGSGNGNGNGGTTTGGGTADGSGEGNDNTGDGGELINTGYTKIIVIVVAGVACLAAAAGAGIVIRKKKEN